MGKFASTVSLNNDQNSGNSRSQREKAKAWGNLVFRLKDGASTQVGLPFMESDYVQRTILTHMAAQDSDEARRDLFKRLVCKAIDNGDFDFRFVVERDDSAIGELDL